MSTVCVVGSANLDIVTPVPRHPVAGETVLGGDHLQVPGGKGANQAVAAARLGADVSFVGRIGDDAPGEALRASLAGAGVDLSNLTVTTDTPSGIATISVGPDGDNAIVVSPGANARLTADDIRDAAPVITPAQVLLLQLEVPIETVTAAAAAATGIVVLNPAPMSEPLAGDLLDHVDLLVPNQTELALLTNNEVEPTSVEEAVGMARQVIAATNVQTVVVTLGALGAVIVADGEPSHVPAPTVTPVDTTGAGDSFCGALAVGLANGLPMLDAVRTAVRVGAATTLRAGAQPSLPTMAEVDQLLS